ncbi:MAG TPA: hypothetical protein VNI01_06990, partial [Elusimicrobiota bacterium]|nr:hypothetical protein [Elusimicrobiota bacterium]
MKISLRILLALILAAPARAGVTRVPRAGIEATSPALAAGTAPGALPVTALDGGALSLPISAPTQAVAVPDGSANSPVVGTRSEDAAVVDDSPAPPAEPVPAENSPTPIVRGSASRDDAAPDPAKHPAAHAAVQAVAENSAVRQAASGSANAPTGLAALFDLSPAALEAAAPGMQGSYWQAPQYRLETLGLSPYPPFDQDFQAEKHASEVFAHVLNDRFLLRGLLRDDPGSFPMSDRRVYEARNLVHRLQTILRIPFGLIEKTAARLAHSR